MYGRSAYKRFLSWLKVFYYLMYNLNAIALLKIFSRGTLSEDRDIENEHANPYATQIEGRLKQHAYIEAGALLQLES